MASRASTHDPGFTKFKEKLSTLRYQHAVVNCGQKLLHLIMRTLICGDINNISSCVRAKLGSNSQYKNSFTKDEQQYLTTGEHKRWDISLLFKVIQKVCGLASVDNNCWTQPIGGNESLEYLITTLKDLRNEQVHKFDLVISEDQLEVHLNKLMDLALRMISALGVRAQEQGKQLSDNESTEIINLVIEIIENVKEKINEGVPASSPPPVAVPESVEGYNDSDEEDAYEADSVQFDNVHVAAGAGRQVSQESSLKKVFEDLQRTFWEFAGPKDVVV